MANKKALNFDLDTDRLIEYYPNKNYRQAYSDIKRFLIANGFKHRQWSGYISKEKMSDKELINVVNRLYDRFPWFEKSVNKFDATNIGRTYDLKLFKEIERGIKEHDLSREERGN